MLMMQCKKVKSNPALGIGLLAASILFVLTSLVIQPFPGAEAQFGLGVTRFFRNFRRGAANVMRPMFRPTIRQRPQQFSTRPRVPFLPQR